MNRLRLGLPALIAGATLLAGLGIAIVLLAGGFFEWGRAEALPFLALRPWVLLLAALVALPQPLPRRASFYGLILLIAAAAETLLVLGLGATNPSQEMLRGLFAGAMLVLLLDVVLQASRRLWRWAPVAAAALLLVLFATPFALRPYAAMIAPAEPEAAAERPQLLLMTGLPIIWGEGGAFDPESRPAKSYRLLEREFDIRPVDALTDESLGVGRLLLLAQPRALAPEELVAFDAWVRRGGRTLILLDDNLDWPSELPPGDFRRPPPVSYLGPLLGHWKVALEPGKRNGSAITEEAVPGMRLGMTSPGRLSGPNCRRPPPHDFLLECEVGEGRAMLVADADLLRDDLWAPLGLEPRQRIADNPLIVAEWLDRLAGIERPLLLPPAQWADPEADRTRALLLAALPLLAGLGAAFALRLKRQR